MARFLWLILTHQNPEGVEKMLEHWRERVEGEIHVLYGGARENFRMLACDEKHFVHNKELVTRDHPRERQSYAEVFRRTVAQIDLEEVDYVYFTEFDQIPLAHDLGGKLARRMEDLDADLMCYGLKRVDRTNHPHWLNHRHESAFWNISGERGSLSRDNVVLSCYGFGQCWRRNAFLEVARLEPANPVYLELWIPTMAHSLGCKVRGIGRDEKWNLPQGEFDAEMTTDLKEKPWFLHPVKAMWD